MSQLPGHLPDLNLFFPGSDAGPSPDYPSSEFPNPVGEIIKPMGEATGQTRDQREDEAAPAQLPPKVEQEAKVEEKPKQFESIAEAIKKSRQERDARLAAEKRESEIKAKLESRSSEPEFKKDPFTYIKGHRLSPEEQVELGRALIYDIVPDKAPPDMRFKLYEARQAREKVEEAKAREEAESAKAKQTKADADMASFNNFVETMVHTSKSLDVAKYPQLADWFGEDTDTLARSMVSTGTNMANEAVAQGSRVDLSPGAILASLETEVARRLTARDQRVAARGKPTQKSSGQQTTGKTLSTSGMNTGSPRAPAMSEMDRINRAIEAGFKK